MKFESVYGSRSNSGNRSNSNSTSKRAATTGLRKKSSKRRTTPRWQSFLQQVSLRSSSFEHNSTSPFQTAASQQAEVHYVIDASQGSRYEPPELHLSVFNRVKKTNGEWGKLKALNLSHNSINELADPTDQKIAAQLMGADRRYTDPYGYGSARSSFSRFELDSSWPREVCELLVASGRLHWTLGMSLPLEEFMPVESIDFLNPAEICINIQEQASPKHSATMEVCIEQNETQIDNNDVVKVADNGIVLLHDRLIRISNYNAIDLWTEAKDSPTI